AEIHAGIQADIDATRDDPETDMRRHQTTVLEGYATGLHRLETELASLHIGRAAAPAGEVRVRRTAQFGWRIVETVGVGLPDLDQGILQRRTGTVEDATTDDDAFALALVVDHPCAEVFVIDAADLAEIRHAADMDVRPGRLRRRFLETIERLNHSQFPSRRFSNKVERRPRSTMSNL